MIIKSIKPILVLTVLSACLSHVYAATPVNPPNVPLESGSASSTKPNMMFILDDSGSMYRDYLGDEIDENLCKTYNANFSRICMTQSSKGTLESFIEFTSSKGVLTQKNTPDALYFIYDLNKAYYNPAITYNAPVDFQGNSLGNASFNAAKYGFYVATPTSVQGATVNLDNLQETYFCKSSKPTTANLSDPNQCVRNGVNNLTNGVYSYHSAGYPNSTYRYPIDGPWTPHYNQIVPTEYCDDNFITCTSNASGGVPAPVRWCNSASNATSTSVVSGTSSGSPKCQKNYSSTYSYVRLGNIKRVPLTNAEKTNYANWFSYYRTRHDSIRTSVGLAFKSIDNSKRVGFITINPGSPVSSSKFLAVRDFGPTQKEAFYNMLYSVAIGGGTPLREALSRVGRYFAGISSGINSGMINSSNPDPMEISCQQNFAILSTDGYWNGNAGVNLSNGSIGNQDNTDSGYSTRSVGAYDGNLSKSTNTLADVAMYFYQTDLRAANATSSSGANLGENNVPISPNDTNPEQHMVTYAISLGLSGFVNYSKDYMSGRNKDFENIKKGTSGACSWTTGVCNWPTPVADDPSALDDLWHATVNGRGKYYSAQNTQDIIDGLTDALNSLIAQTASSSSASTSSPNITATENTLYYSTYRTVHWDGDVAARKIDPITGDVSSTVSWRAASLLNSKTSAHADTRKLYTSTIQNGAQTRIDFTYSALDTTAKTYFSSKCNSLSQCQQLSSSDQTLVNDGANMVNYLRGHRGYEMNGTESQLYRTREFLLGDIVDASPVYVSTSPYNWSDVGYPQFKSSVATRKPMLYVGSNDGFVHALNATTGVEEWAYAPRQILPNMYAMADKNYSVNHQFYVNGNISVMDVKLGSSWKTVLVGAMGQGSKGYYALDITNPDSPVVLWEKCMDSSLCSTTESTLGWTYGNPIITKNGSNNWVVYVTSGYDNSNGVGYVYELDLATGAKLRSFQTGVGVSNANPSGLANINAFYTNFYNNNQTDVLYGGDLNGDIWRIQVNSPISGSTNSNSNVNRVGYTADARGTRQPITAKIELGTIYEKPILFIATGQYLNLADYNTTGIQSVYAIKDPYVSCLTLSELAGYSNTCSGSRFNYGNLRANSNITVQTSTVSGTKVTAAPNKYNTVDWDSQIGWYFDFNSQVGERVNIDPTLVLGTLNIITNVPVTNTCNMGGNAWIYQFNYLNGNPILGQDNLIGRKHTGGFVVGQVVARIDSSGAIKNFITDATGNVQSVGVNINTESLTSNKASWNEIIK